jgi:hypothetical protein
MPVQACCWSLLGFLKLTGHTCSSVTSCVLVYSALLPLQIHSLCRLSIPFGNWAWDWQFLIFSLKKLLHSCVWLSVVTVEQTMISLLVVPSYEFSTANSLHLKSINIQWFYWMSWTSVPFQIYFIRMYLYMDIFQCLKLYSSFWLTMCTHSIGMKV